MTKSTEMLSGPLFALAQHVHPLEEHAHPLELHDHPLERHDHPLPGHDHSLPKHDHRDLRAELRGAMRALLAVFEVGSLNSAQQRAIHAVRVIIGDAHGSGCPHELTVYEENDRLICQACRVDLTAQASGKTS